MFKVFAFLIEGIGWLHIVAGPLILGLGLGFWVYSSLGNTAGFVLAIVIAKLGLCIGILWATRVWKKTGTTKFLSRISETQDLDEDAK